MDLGVVQFYPVELAPSQDQPRVPPFEDQTFMVVQLYIRWHEFIQFYMETQDPFVSDLVEHFVLTVNTNAGYRIVEDFVPILESGLASDSTTPENAFLPSSK